MYPETLVMWVIYRNISVVNNHLNPKFSYDYALNFKEHDNNV